MLHAYMRGLAKVSVIAARLQGNTQSQQLMACWVKLESLMQPHISHPNVALKVHSKTMKHKKIFLNPP